MVAKNLGALNIKNTMPTALVLAQTIRVMKMNVKDLPVIPAILGIDFASKRTGVAMLSLKEPIDLISYKCIEASSDDDDLHRWAYTINAVSEFIVQCGGRPAAVAIEQPNSFRGGSTVRILCGGWGALMLWVFQHDMPPFDINTSHAKSVFCGKKPGKGKQPTLDKANAMFGLDLKWHRDDKKTDDNISDAIQVAWVLRKELIESDPWFKEQSEK